MGPTKYHKVHQLTLAGIAGWESDGIYDVTLFRQGVVVGQLWLAMQGDLPGNFVVSRGD